jgi:hypothetical protein
MTITNEQLRKLVSCKCGPGFHQIDLNVPGLNAGGLPATTCPKHPSFNLLYAIKRALENSGLTFDDLILAIAQDIMNGGVISIAIERDIASGGVITRAMATAARSGGPVDCALRTLTA